MKRILVVLILATSSLSFGQLLLEENFDYTEGTTLSNNGWTAYNSGPTELYVLNNNLSFTSYPSNQGKCAQENGSGYDYYKQIGTTTTSGTLYASFLVNVIGSYSGTSSDYYIFALGSTGANTPGGRVYIRRSGSSLAFGLSKTSGIPIYTGYDYSLNTTYLVVIKYTIVAEAKNDLAYLYILSNTIPVDDSNPTLSVTTETTSSDPSNLDVVILRQDVSSNIVFIDGIRVATDWSQAPLPVELTSFESTVSGNKVHLNWQTATEVNNFGFGVERKTGSENWMRIGFIQGSGNSNSPKEYSFTDEPKGGKEFKYRLRQIDFNGAYEYSWTVSALLENVNQFILDQNFPNPFNPVTKISYTIPQGTVVRLKIYDMLAKEVAELVNSFQEAGRYEVTFDGSYLSSGTYFYKLEAGYFSEVKKLILIK